MGTTGTRNQDQGTPEPRNTEEHQGTPGKTRGPQGGTGATRGQKGTGGKGGNNGNKGAKEPGFKRVQEEKPQKSSRGKTLDDGTLGLGKFGPLPRIAQDSLTPRGFHQRKGKRQGKLSKVYSEDTSPKEERRTFLFHQGNFTKLSSTTRETGLYSKRPGIIPRRATFG